MASPDAPAQRIGRIRDDDRSVFELETLATIAETMNASLDRERIVKEILYSVLGSFGLKGGAVYLRVEGGAEGEFVRSQHKGGAWPPRLRLEPRLVGQFLGEPAPVHLHALLERVPVDYPLAEGTSILRLCPNPVLAPILSQGHWMGLLVAGEKLGNGDLGERELRFLSILANQAGVALTNAANFERLRRTRDQLDRRVHHLVTLSDFCRVSMEVFDWPEAAANLLYTALGHLGLRDGVLLSLESGADRYIWRCGRGAFESGRNPLEDVPAGDVMACFDADPSPRALESLPPDAAWADALRKAGVRAVIPVRVQKAVEVLVLLGGKIASRPWSGDDYEFLTVLADEAAIAIENLRLYEQQIASERMAAVGEAVAGLSHDINGILHGLQAAGRRIEKWLERQAPELTEASATEFRQWWGIVRDNERHLSDLVTGLLEYCRERPASRETVNLAKLAADAVFMKQTQYESRGLQVEYEAGGGAHEILGDPVRLYRVLVNLIDNAADALANREDGVIAVKTAARDGAVEVSVRDNGVGIPERDLPQIFERLFTTKAGGQGSGLGLAIVRKIVEEHGGRIDVKSRPGAGTFVTIAFPAAEGTRGD